VGFEPFVGVAPRQYMNLFAMGERKRDGQVLEWKKSQALPTIMGSPASYMGN
jgi:hypothetical protein